MVVSYNFISSPATHLYLCILLLIQFSLNKDTFLAKKCTAQSIYFRFSTVLTCIYYLSHFFFSSGKPCTCCCDSSTHTFREKSMPYQNSLTLAIYFRHCDTQVLVWDDNVRYSRNILRTDFLTKQLGRSVSGSECQRCFQPCHLWWWR